MRVRIPLRTRIHQLGEAKAHSVIKMENSECHYFLTDSSGCRESEAGKLAGAEKERSQGTAAPVVARE